MAREILHGHLFTFYWGQNYGGGEPYVVAALFAVAGQSRLTLGLAPVLLDAIAALLVWRIGRRLFDSRVGVIAALVFWVWPEVYLYLSTVEYGFRYLTLVCGLAVFLFALRLTQQPRPRLGDWAALGLFLGVGWWSSPEIVYYAVPALLWLVYCAGRRGVRPRLAGVALFVATAALGALPWLVANVGRGYPSLQPARLAHDTTWVGRLGTFFGHVAPLVFGVRLRGSGDWLFGPAFGVTLYCLFAVFVLTWVVVLVLRRRAGLLVVFVVLFPLAYAYSPFSRYWNDGRYAVYLAPAIALLVASALVAVARVSSRLARAAPAIGLIAALAMTAGAAARLAPYVPLVGAGSARSGWETWTTDPSQWLRPLITALERSHVQGAYAGYWVAYALTFEARGGVVAADPGIDRYPPYLAAVTHSRRQAWVFPRLSTLNALNMVVGAHPWLPDRSLTLADFESFLKSRNTAYRTESVGYFTIVYPARGVALPAVGATASTLLRSVPGPLG
jgi:4-amino-4-deoxy-L-arabinose transferase-like glycosyltransferase